jgi:hypothetical protein
VWPARQHHDARLEREQVVGPKQALEYPATHEPRTSGDEEALSPDLVPEAFGMGHNVLQIRLGQALGGVYAALHWRHDMLEVLWRSAWFLPRRLRSSKGRC